MQVLKPKVSVCMITYNHEKFIKKAIEGVLMQQCNFVIELVISNDCSTDLTEMEIQSFLDHHPKAYLIKYVNHVENLGMMPNFIFALKECKGEYIALCEGDDYWTDPLKLQKQINYLDENKDYVLCFHKVYILKRDGGSYEDFLDVPEEYEYIETLLSQGNFIRTPSVVFRNIIRKFPYEFEEVPFGDFFLYMMLAQHGKLKCFHDVMSIYRMDIGVISRMSDRDILRNNVKVYSYMLSYLKDEELKKIVLKRQLEVLTNHYIEIERKYNKVKRINDKLKDEKNSITYKLYIKVIKVTRVFDRFFKQ